MMHDVSSSAGHTYCSSCVEQVIKTHVLKCPECRHDFEPKHVRRIYITPTSNNRSATQAAPSGSLEEDGFIKQATHIANRLKKMDPDTPAQSLRTAVEIMEHVATIQSERAQVRSLASNPCLCPIVAAGNSLESRARILDRPGSIFRGMAADQGVTGPGI